MKLCLCFHVHCLILGFSTVPIAVIFFASFIPYHLLSTSLLQLCHPFLYFFLSLSLPSLFLFFHAFVRAFQRLEGEMQWPSLSPVCSLGFFCSVLSLW